MVTAIRDAVARVDAEYIQSFVDFGAVADASGEDLAAAAAAAAAAAGTVLCPDLEVDSWLGFEFDRTDFGTGPPRALLAPDIPVDGLMVFVPSGTARGGVDLFIGRSPGGVPQDLPLSGLISAGDSYPHTVAGLVAGLHWNPNGPNGV